MSELNALFRKRIGYPEQEKITFASLGRVLERTAKAIPFENMCIIQKRTYDITKENLIAKILVNQEGGLCYELNTIFSFFLRENGFRVELARGVVYNHEAQRYPTMGRTHVTILCTHEEQTYVVDTGFGGNLPLKPVPLSGETVSSENGEFRIRKADSEHGDHVLEMKLKHKDTDWRIGYAFDPGRLVTDLAECNEIQAIIAGHEESSFNKHPLLTRRTDGGSVTLTDKSLTQWKDGIVSKESVADARFDELLKEHFGMTRT